MIFSAEEIRHSLEMAKRRDLRELAGQINEASQEYAKLLGNDHPSDAEALAIGLALGVLKQLVASWEPPKG